MYVNIRIINKTLFQLRKKAAQHRTCHDKLFFFGAEKPENGRTWNEKRQKNFKMIWRWRVLFCVLARKISSIFLSAGAEGKSQAWRSLYDFTLILLGISSIKTEHSLLLCVHIFLTSIVEAPLLYFFFARFCEKKQTILRYFNNNSQFSWWSHLPTRLSLSLTHGCLAFTNTDSASSLIAH